MSNGEHGVPPEPPSPPNCGRRRPEGLPTSYAHQQTQAVTELLRKLTELADLGVKLLEELWTQAQEERAEQERREKQAQAGPARSRSGF